MTGRVKLSTKVFASQGDWVISEFKQNCELNFDFQGYISSATVSIEGTAYFW